MTTSGIPRFLANTLADQQFSPADSLGQQVATFTYEVVNGLTGIRVGTVTPLRTTIPVLVHNTQNTIMRTLTGLNFGVDDTASMNPITDRIKVFMTVDTPDGEETFPLGRYMYDSTTKQILSGGDLSQNGLFDEMFIVDQQLPYAFGVRLNETVDEAIVRLLAPLVDAGLIQYRMEGSNVLGTGAWPIGTSRAKVLSDLCVQGSYFQPWFDNDGILRIITAFNPADRLPDFDFDASTTIHRNTISYTNDFLDAPNRFVVINTAGTTNGLGSGSFGFYDVPNSAPWSLINRGFLVIRTYDKQASANTDMNALAASIAQQDIVFERTQMSTAPDPRHDSYNVIRWQDSNWMEISYSFQLQSGSPTLRTLRKAYS